MNKKTKIFIFAGGVILFLLIKKRPIKKMISESEYFNKLTAFIKNKEGGLSNNPNDKASKYPSPSLEKYHTNKGVTYKTFIDSANSLKFSPSLQNFLNMPNDIWLKIFTEKYYNRAKYTSNPILNGFIAYWLWQGWDAKLLPTNLVSKVLASGSSDLNKLNALADLRKNYFNAIASKYPEQMQFKKGWLKTVTDYQSTFAPYL